MLTQVKKKYIMTSTTIRTFQKTMCNNKRKKERFNQNLAIRQKNREVYFAKSRQQVPMILELFNANKSPLKALQNIRKMFKENAVPSHSFRNSLMSYLLNIFKSCDDSSKFEILWILTNIVATSTILAKELCAKGGISFLCDLIRRRSQERLDVIQQSIWVLANIAGDNIAAVREILDIGIVDHLIQMLVNSNLDIQQLIMWFFTNITASYRLDFSLTKLMQAITATISRVNDEVVIFYALSTFENISKNIENVEIAENFKRLNIIPQILQLDTGAKHLMYRLIGQILSGNDDLVEIILRCGYLDIIEEMNFENNIILLWSIGNIFASSCVQNMQFSKKTGMVRKIIANIGKQNYDIAMESCFCICNLILSMDSFGMSTINFLPFSTIIQALKTFALGHGGRIQVQLKNDIIKCLAILEELILFNTL